jgi:uncharacterized protein
MRERRKPPKKRPTRHRSYPSPWCYVHRDATVRGVLLGAMRYADPRTGRIGFCLDILDLDREDRDVERISLDFFAHGVSFHPTQPRRATLFEKRGPGACEVDLVDQRVGSSIAPMPFHHFYGHGSFAIDGEVVFAVESHLDTGEGAVSVRDAETFRVLETFPTFGARPHDCVLIERGSVLAITNGGAALGHRPLPCVTFVDVSTRKLLERHEVTNPHVNTGHIALTSKRDFAVVSAPRDGLPEEAAHGGLSLRAGKKSMTHVTSPAEVVGRMVGETLSVAIHEPTGTVAATSPRGGSVSFWNLFSRTLRKAVDLPNARGVTLTLDEKAFVVAHGEGLLAFFDVGTLEAMSVPARARSFGGSHVYAWAYPAN